MWIPLSVYVPLLDGAIGAYVHVGATGAGHAPILVGVCGYRYVPLLDGAVGAYVHVAATGTGRAPRLDDEQHRSNERHVHHRQHADEGAGRVLEEDFTQRHSLHLHVHLLKAVEVLREVVRGKLVLDVRGHRVLLREHAKHSRSSVENHREGLAGRPDAHVHEVLGALLVHNGDAVDLREHLRVLGRIHHLRAAQQRELALGRLVDFERGKHVLVHEVVVLVQRRDADDRPVPCHVKLHNVLAEEHIADQQTLHARGRRLNARLVRLGKVPGREGDLPGLLANLEPERAALLPVLREVIPGDVGQLALHVVCGDYKARGARVHDGGSAIVLLGGALELQQLDGRLLAVSELERGRPHNEVVRRKRGRVPHRACGSLGVVAAELNLGSVVGGEEGELAAEVRSVRVLVLSVGHGEEDGGREVAARFGKAETEDAVNAVEVGAVAVRDHAERRRRLVVSHVHLIDAREAAKVGAVGVVEVERLRCLRDKRRGRRHIEVARILRPVRLIEELAGGLLVGSLELASVRPCSPAHRCALELEDRVGIAGEAIAGHLVRVGLLVVLELADVGLGVFLRKVCVGIFQGLASCLLTADSWDCRSQGHNSQKK
mmetsp:Transcript_26162/g.53322  ORF Transcript_26162/g.53322 Transcript_26162/m.53322 type:complete len:604 (+) Transcript_26162:312-2123(+)